VKKSLKCDHGRLVYNKCNFVSRALREFVHFNASTYVHVQKAFSEIWHVILKHSVHFNRDNIARYINGSDDGVKH
jgi:hypothetical protein